jgi:hypothetical protein
MKCYHAATSQFGVCRQYEIEFAKLGNSVTFGHRLSTLNMQKTNAGSPVFSGIFRRFSQEAPPGFEPGNNGFAIRCLTAWLRRLA